MRYAEALARRFGARLQDLRRHADLSHLALSTKRGVHVSFVSAIEQGRRQPSLMTLAKLAAGLDARLEGLVAGADDDRNGAALGRIAQLVRAMPRDKAARAVELVETLVKRWGPRLGDGPGLPLAGHATYSPRRRASGRRRGGRDPPSAA